MHNLKSSMLEMSAKTIHLLRDCMLCHVRLLIWTECPEDAQSLKPDSLEIKAATVCDGVNGSLWSCAESPLSHYAILYPGTACLILRGGTDVGLFDEPNQTVCDEERVFLVALVDSDIGSPPSSAASDRVVCKCSRVCVSVQHGEIERAKARGREGSFAKEST